MLEGHKPPPAKDLAAQKSRGFFCVKRCREAVISRATPRSCCTFPQRRRAPHRHASISFQPSRRDAVRRRRRIRIEVAQALLDNSMESS